MSAALPGAKLRPILDAALAEVEAAADALSRRYAADAGKVSPAAAQAERRLLHAVFLQLPVPVFLLGQDRTIRRANTAAAQLLGSAPGYATGKQFTALIDVADRARVQTQLANAFRTGQPRRLGCSLLSADGLVEAELTVCLAGLRADTDQLIVAVTATGAVPAGRPDADIPLTRPGERGDLELVKQLTRRLDLAAETARMLLGHVTVSESAAVQRLRAPAGRRAGRLGHRRRGAGRPAAAAVRDRAGGPRGRGTGPDRGRDQPGARHGALPGPRVGQLAAGHARRGPQRAGRRPRRDPPGHAARRHLRAVGRAVGRRAQLRRADPGPAGQPRLLRDGRRGHRRVRGRAAGPGHPGRPPVPAAQRRRRGVPVQLAAPRAAPGARRGDRHRAPGRRGTRRRRRLLRRLPDTRRDRPGHRRPVRQRRGTPSRSSPPPGTPSASWPGPTRTRPASCAGRTTSCWART